MNISRIFILRPIATSLLMVALFLSGVLAYRFLPISALPQIDYPTIQVQTFYPGASPDVMAAVVTAPLETQFGSMSGLVQMSSFSSAGASVITLQFDLGIELDVAEQEVQAGINAALTLLPSDLPTPPVYNKVNPADPPVMTLALTSDILPMTRLEDLADTRMAQKLSQLSGVGMVTLSGGERPAIRVKVNPKALARADLTMEDIRTAISAANVNTAKGSLDGRLRSSTINANDQLESPEEYVQTIIGYKNGAPIRLGDIAEVEEGAENALLSAYIVQADADSVPKKIRQAIIISVQRQPGANVIAVADAINARLPMLAASLPNSVQLEVITDRTATIRATVADVQFELVLAVVLVIAVIWVFLRNARATLIPALAVPLSLVGTLGVMYLANFSLNNLTLMALVIASGFVVDDAIVVIENITRYLEKGMRPVQAALTGAGQIGFTIISLTLSLVAVLIPLLFMGDVAGRLFREFAITLAVTILISAVVSLTLTPMLCAVFLKAERRKRGGEKDETNEKEKGFFPVLLKLYDRALVVVLRHQTLMLWVALGSVLFTGFLYVAVSKGFFPVQDTGLLQGMAEAPQNTSFRGMAARQQRLADLLLSDPAVRRVAFFVGVDGQNPSIATSRLTIELKSLDEREDRAPAIAKRLMERAHSEIPGTTLYLNPVQDLTIEDRTSRTMYQVTMEAVSREDLALWERKFRLSLNEQKELSNVATDLLPQGTMVYVNVNRDMAGRLGISMQDIDNALYNALGQRLISTIFTQTNQYKVVLESASTFRKGPQDMEAIFVEAGDGKPVPLTSVATIEERPVQLGLARQGQFPAATLSFNVAEGWHLGDAVEAVKRAIQEIEAPESVRFLFQGAARAFDSSTNNQLWLILAAIATVYIVLGVLYESYVHPLTILSTLPSAGIGAILALIMLDMELGVVGIIGLILLIGIVKKNAIMMVDFALELENREGRDSVSAIHEACLLRLRPILMTTLCALLSALPLILTTGMGAELRRPLGVTMVGGLVFSQLLTLFTTPVIYIWFDKFSRKRKG